MSTINTLFHLDAAVLSDVGMRRKQNQDRALARPDLGLFIVADGMGGHQGGETASLVCVESIEEFVANAAANPALSSISDSELLQQSLSVANLRLLNLSHEMPSLRGMGTTATTLKITENKATIAQIGDSRAYLLNKNGFWQITRDHSLVQEKLRAGLIRREQLKTDQMKNVITRSVGFDHHMRCDVFTFTIEEGDIFLLCSDGLTGPLEDTEIFAILESNMNQNAPLSQMTQALIDAANLNGGEDNISALLVRMNHE